MATNNKQQKVKSKTNKQKKVNLRNKQQNNKKKSKVNLKRKRGRPRKKVVVPRKKVFSSIKMLRGMRDILPAEQDYWRLVIKIATEIAEAYGFKRIDTPILEATSLFKRGIGTTTDVVNKEMFTFTDQNKQSITLRPEGTASVVRSYVEQGMINLSQPVKLYYYGPMFRRERPQAGRYRQFHQFGLEAIGSDQAVIDAQIILFNYILFKTLKLPVKIQINSLGCVDCRPKYQKKLSQYLNKHKKELCSDCRKRLITNPLRVLDCKNEQCQHIANQAPQINDFLCLECKEHFMRVLELLDEAEVAYTYNPLMARGLDYYTRTVFEIWPDSKEEPDNIKNMSGESDDTKGLGTDESKDIVDDSLTEAKATTDDGPVDAKAMAGEGRQSAFGGGGRYDNLIEELGGVRSTGACGVALGIERIVKELERRNIRFSSLNKRAKVFIAQLGDLAQKKALKLLELLRKNHISVSESLSKASLRSQLEKANKLKVKLVLILGQKEILDKTIIVRNMITGTQEIVDINKIVDEIKKRL